MRAYCLRLQLIACMIYIASDHAGFELKGLLASHLKSRGYEVEDLGPYKYDKSDDYPDWIYPCAVKVAQNQPQAQGIVLGFSGQGEAMVANKVKGIRAAVYYGGDLEIIRLSKEHNNANVLALGAGFLTPKEAEAAVDFWLEIGFAGERHARRINKIAKLEQQ